MVVKINESRYDLGLIVSCLIYILHLHPGMPTRKAPLAATFTRARANPPTANRPGRIKPII